MPGSIAPLVHRNARQAISRVYSVGLFNSAHLRGRLLELSFDPMCNLLARIRNTPTVELLATAGAGILGDRAQWEARLQRDHDDRRDRADAKRTQGGLTNRVWGVEDLVAMMDAKERIIA